MAVPSLEMVTLLLCYSTERVPSRGAPGLMDTPLLLLLPLPLHYYMQ